MNYFVLLMLIVSTTIFTSCYKTVAEEERLEMLKLQYDYIDSTSEFQYEIDSARLTSFGKGWNGDSLINASYYFTIKYFTKTGQENHMEVHVIFDKLDSSELILIPGQMGLNPMDFFFKDLEKAAKLLSESLVEFEIYAHGCYGLFNQVDLLNSSIDFQIIPFNDNMALELKFNFDFMLQGFDDDQKSIRFFDSDFRIKTY